MRSTRWPAVLTIVGIALAAFIAYNVGVSHGLAQAAMAAAAQGTAAPGPASPVPPYAYGWYGWYRPWGFGFFPIFFFLFIWLFLLRGLFWGGPWRRWHHYRGDVPPSFEEWHRRSHERMREGQTRA